MHFVSLGLCIEDKMHLGNKNKSIYFVFLPIFIIFVPKYSVNMTQGKTIVSIIAAVAWLFVLNSCQKSGVRKQAGDKDEEHGLIVAQELSNSRVQAIEEDATG